MVHSNVSVKSFYIHWRSDRQHRLNPMAPRRFFRGLSRQLLLENPHKLIDVVQPLWYFLASAVFIGLLLALVLHFTLRAFVVVFRLDKKPPPKPIPPKGHDAISYRKAREEKKRKQLDEQQRLAAQARLIASQPLLQEAVREARKMPPSGAAPTSPLSPISPTNTLPARPGLLQETILEHSEEDDDDSVF